MFVIGIATINCQLAFNVCWFFAKKNFKKQRRKKTLKMRFIFSAVDLLYRLAANC